MAVTTISKISNVVFVTQPGLATKNFFGYSGTFDITDDGLRVRIRLAAPHQAHGLELLLNWNTELTVNGQVPSTASEAKTLLNSIFGS